MKNVAVTGATSFIGVYIIKEYLKNNCEITFEDGIKKILEFIG